MQVSSTCDVRVTGGGDQVAAHAGLFALGRFADGLGLSEALSAVVPAAGERAPVHDRGKVLVHLLLMLAGGGESCSDIEHLRAQRVLFGEVASDSTLYRTLRGLGPDVLEGLASAVAGVRSVVWERRGDTESSAPVVLDIDSTLVEVHSQNKTGTAAHFKGGFGFHPMLCATDDGEPLSVMLGPGNAAANNICDHIEVLDAAVAQLPASVAAGHREHDDAVPVRRLQLRVDSAGCSTHIAAACRARNVEFFMTARSNNPGNSRYRPQPHRPRQMAAGTTPRPRTRRTRPGRGAHQFRRPLRLARQDPFHHPPRAQRLVIAQHAAFGGFAAAAAFTPAPTAGQFLPRICFEAAVGMVGVTGPVDRLRAHRGQAPGVQVRGDRVR